MMLFDSIVIPNWMVISFIVVILAYVYITWNDGTFQRMGIPGPKPVPLFGNLLSEFTKFVPDLELEFTKKYGMVYGVFEAWNPTLRVADPEIIREICIKQFVNFTNHREIEMSGIDPIFSLFLTSMKGEQWKQTRNVMTPTFTSGKLKQMIPLIEKSSQQLLISLRETTNKGESFEIKAKLSNYILDVIASCAFGMEVNAQTNEDDIFGKYAKRLMATKKYFLIIAFLILPNAVLKRIPISIFDIEAMNFFKRIIDEMIKCRQSKSQRRSDFLQIMLDSLSQADGQELKLRTENEQNEPGDTVLDKNLIKKVLTPNGVLAQSLLFLTAGLETVASAMSFVSYLLATNMENQEKLLKEIDEVLAKNDEQINYETVAQMHYMDMVISETLRMYPPAIRSDRQCNNTCQIKDMLIPKGLVVTLCIYAVQNDEQFYENPKKFDPERFSPENKEKRNPFAFIPFGVGPRNCIGMRFAQMQMKITLASILKEFRFVCAPETEVPLKFKIGFPGFVPSNGIWLNLEKRFP